MLKSKKSIFFIPLSNILYIRAEASYSDHVCLGLIDHYKDVHLLHEHKK